MRLISVKHTGVFANLKVLVVLAACLHLQGEEREERKMCSLPTLHRPQECGGEGDEGLLLTGEKIRGEKVQEQVSSCQGGLV